MTVDPAKAKYKSEHRAMFSISAVPGASRRLIVSRKVFDGWAMIYTFVADNMLVYCAP
jgi:hypothetical protein